MVFLPVFVHLHFNQPLAQCLAINGSLIIIGGIAGPSHPKEEDPMSRERGCASHLPLLPFTTQPHPHPGPPAEKYEIHTKKH